MKNRQILMAVLCAGILLSMGGAQAQKKTLDQSAFDGWKQVSKPQISDNGRWTAYELKPAWGDGSVVVYDAENHESDTIHRASGSLFFGSESRPWIVAKISPTYEQQRQEKILKTKPDEKRTDTLFLLSLADNVKQRIASPPGLKNYQVADKEQSGVIAYLYEVAVEKRDSTDKKNLGKFNRLVVSDLVSEAEITVVDSVESFQLSRNGKMLLYTVEGDSVRSVWTYVDGKHRELYTATEGKTGPLAVDEAGRQGAYLVTQDTTKTGAKYQLFYFTTKDFAPQRVAANGADNGFVVSEFGRPSFSKKGTRLEFGMAPQSRVLPKDTLPADEKCSVDLWSYTDTLIMPQQLARAKSIKEQTYMAIYDTKSGEWALLGDKYLSEVTFAEQETAPYALGLDVQPYKWESTWESPGFNDLYVVDVETGERRKIAERIKMGGYYKGSISASISPSSKYVAWYDAPNGEWKGVATAKSNSTEVSLSKDIPHQMHVQGFDMPDDTPSEGIAGWTTDERAVIYDNFDLWLVDPACKKSTICLTQGVGRRDSIAFRYVQLDPEVNTIDLSKPLILSALNKASKDGGYYSMPAGGGAPQKLLMDNHRYTFVAKSKQEDKVLWQRENFQNYRDLWSSDLLFADVERVSDANPQAAEYNWGTVQKIAWEDLNGIPTEGLLYLPEDYDSTRQYPVIVYFYDTHTKDIHKHVHPQPSWSIVIPAVCTSQDYVVFMPDIRYRVGYPGQSCYDAVVSGAKMLVERGIADPRRMGLQGQSWGGYQISYLVTRTDMFRCASAGAPVSNMTSATGGIRWGTGLSRAFQYEHGQSRIGGSLWEKPIEYIENSPVFFANKVRTPMLMRHDDADESVPWTQGIEYFLALRRHGVAVWMLNYNGEPHNLKSYAAKLDWDLRLMQFLDHYLKDTPAPRWMREGISVTDKGVDSKLDY